MLLLVIIVGSLFGDTLIICIYIIIILILIIIIQFDNSISSVGIDLFRFDTIVDFFIFDVGLGRGIYRTCMGPISRCGTIRQRDRIRIWSFRTGQIIPTFSGISFHRCGTSTRSHIFLVEVIRDFETAAGFRSIVDAENDDAGCILPRFLTCLGMASNTIICI